MTIKKTSRWQWGILVITLLFAVPMFTVFSFVFYGANETWRHLLDTVLQDYILNSLILLMLGVSIGTLSMGITTAWLTSICRFPGRKVFQWALLLPLAACLYYCLYLYRHAGFFRPGTDLSSGNLSLVSP